MSAGNKTKESFCAVTLPTEKCNKTTLLMLFEIFIIRGFFEKKSYFYCKSMFRYVCVTCYIICFMKYKIVFSCELVFFSPPFPPVPALLSAAAMMNKYLHEVMEMKSATEIKTEELF